MTLTSCHKILCFMNEINTIYRKSHRVRLINDVQNKNTLSSWGKKRVCLLELFMVSANCDKILAVRVSCETLVHQIAGYTLCFNYRET